MKMFVLYSAILGLSLSVFAHEHGHEHDESILNKAPVVFSGIAAVEDFKTVFEASGATLGSELVGFKAKKVGDQVQASVYNIPEEAYLKNSNYDCHYHGDSSGDVEEVHCHGIGDSEPRDYRAAQGSFSAAEFRKAAESAVSLFRRVLGDPKKIEDAQFWRSFVGNEANIQVKLVWRKGNGTLATNFMYCHNHQHGGEVEIDCHRQRNPGPFQPEP